MKTEERQAYVQPPLCVACGVAHELQEPHVMSPTYRRHFATVHGRAPTWADAIGHTRGLIRAASEAALQADRRV